MLNIDVIIALKSMSYVQASYYYKLHPMNEKYCIIL